MPVIYRLINVYGGREMAQRSSEHRWHVRVDQARSLALQGAPSITEHRAKAKIKTRHVDGINLLTQRTKGGNRLESEHCVYEMQVNSWYQT